MHIRAHCFCAEQMPQARIPGSIGAFTFVELLVVIIIIGILAAIAIQFIINGLARLGVISNAVSSSSCASRPPAIGGCLPPALNRRGPPDAAHCMAPSAL